MQKRILMFFVQIPYKLFENLVYLKKNPVRNKYMLIPIGNKTWICKIICIFYLLGCTNLKNILFCSILLHNWSSHARQPNLTRKHDFFFVLTFNNRFFNRIIYFEDFLLSSENKNIFFRIFRKRAGRARHYSNLVLAVL